MIPKVIHQIWIQGYDSIPSQLKEYHDGCQRINNDFVHILWDEQKIVKLMKKYFDKKFIDAYNSFTIAAQKADFARYIILYVYGGIYLDMDMVCRKNLTPFLKFNFFFTTQVFYTYHESYLNGIIGCVPKHPAFIYLFRNIFERLKFTNIPSKVSYSTGTKVLYKSIHDYIRDTGDDNFQIIDRKYLHPCTPFDKDSCVNECEDCYIAHTNHASWCPQYVKFFNKYVLKDLRTKLLILGLIIIFIIIIIIFAYRRK